MSTLFDECPLPLGNELVLTWGSLGMNFNSHSKFVEKHLNHVTNKHIALLKNVLEIDTKLEGEILPSNVSVLPNGAKLKDGLIILKNLENYDFDYQSYEILNEIYRALVIILDSVEVFYSNFYLQPLDEFLTDNPLDDSASSDVILVYDTSDMDNELETVIIPLINYTLSDDILKSEKEKVISKYFELRDRIKFFCMDIAFQVDMCIDKLLLCVNGSKKYHVKQNTELRVLELMIDDNGYERRLRKGEEVFYPFHNKMILEEFSKRLHSTF